MEATRAPRALGWRALEAQGAGQARRRLYLVLGLAVGALLLVTASASAAKQVNNYFGTASGFGAKGGEFSNPRGAAVNSGGAGPAEPGEVYVVDGRFPIESNRVERFSRDAEGNFHFVSAWGAGVQGGGTDYEICTVAASCHAATASAGNGALNEPSGIAVDQDTGQVYVVDAGNNRVNVYEGDGTFLRSFGFDVTASGPGNVPGPEEEQKLLVKADGGHFSLAFRGRATGPRGTGARTKTKTINTFVTTEGTFTVGLPVSGTAIAPNTTVAKLGAGELTLSKTTTEFTSSDEPIYGDNFPFNASAAEVESALNALPSVGGELGAISVTRTELAANEFEYTFHFGGALAGEDVPALESTHKGLTLGAETGTATVSTVADSGALETCAAAAGDICKAGDSGSQLGEIMESKNQLPGFSSGANAIALSPADGDPASGKAYVADSGNGRVNIYALQGGSPSTFGAGSFFNRSGEVGTTPESLAVDSRGIVYASTADPSASGGAGLIERYDSEGVDGPPGFLAPIPSVVPEHQRLTIDATAGQYTLSFGGETTGDIAFDAAPAAVQEALEALPSVGPSGVEVEKAPGAILDIYFEGSLFGQDVEQLACAGGALSGGSGCAVATVADGKAGAPGETTRLAVEPDPDGAGPRADVLYAAGFTSHPFGSGATVVEQFGPLNAPGLSAPPTAFDAIHGGTSRLGIRPGGTGETSGGLAVDSGSGDLFVTQTFAAGKEAHGVYVLGQVGPPPTAAINSVDQITATSARINATINPNGPANVSFRVEYSTDGSNWQQGPSAPVGHQETPQMVSAVLDPAPDGLAPNTLYHVRIVATKPGNEPVTTSELTFTTLAPAPEAETTGSPIRTATTALLSGRVNPRNTATSYHFEYGSQGPCDSNPCAETEAHALGSGDEVKLVAQQVEGLEPGTTYHYRVVADSGAPGLGADMTVVTRASDAPLNHGHLSGPPESDRGYEQVIVPNTGGNPLLAALGFSADGNRAVYRLFGGAPISDSGTQYGLYFAERTASGWQTRRISPGREELVGPNWQEPLAASLDLSTIFGINRDSVVTGKTAFFHLDPFAAPTKIFEPETPQVPGGPLMGFGLAADGSRPVAVLQGGALDPAHPEASDTLNAYDLSSGTPALLDLMPDGSVPACGLFAGEASEFPLPSQATHWVSADGSRFVFPSQGDDCSATPQLYLRQIEAEATKLISGPPVSGPSCGAALLKSTPGAVFFRTKSRLVAEDAPATCETATGGGDVYRYDIAGESLKCVTCVASVPADVQLSAIAGDGSRVYFSTSTHLLPGALPDGQLAAYRVKTTSGDLAYVGPGKVGELAEEGGALSADGSVLLLRSDAAALNTAGGPQNGGTQQYYLYDDRDRSLVCASCPQDGSPAQFGVAQRVAPLNSPELNLTPLSADGRTFAFATDNSLLSPDQNTAGPEEKPGAGGDVYEWRDGRLLLISDGLTDWPGDDNGPAVQGVSPSGRDVFFSAATQYTADALDGYKRLYDARIGGGFEFPEPPPPCPLEVCQGTPKGAPEEQEPGSTNFAGQGHKTPAARHHKKHKKAHKKKAHKQAHHHKRARHRAGHNGRSGR